MEQTKRSTAVVRTVTASVTVWLRETMRQPVSPRMIIIESVDSISKDERGFPLTQYITNGRISRGGYTFTHFKHHHRVLRLIFYRMSV